MSELGLDGLSSLVGNGSSRPLTGAFERGPIGALTPAARISLPQICVHRADARKLWDRNEFADRERRG